MRLLAIVVFLSSCGGVGFSLKDINASISANACAGVKVEHGRDGFEVEASAALCGKAEALGIPIEACIDWEHAPDVVHP